MPDFDKDDDIRLSPETPASDPVVEAYVERTERSWGTRIGSSLKGILAGILMVLVAVGVLFWNEGRAVRTADALSEGAGTVMATAADRVDPALEGKLVLVSGRVASGGRLTDPLFAVSSEGVRLTRKVEMFQWIEHSRSETQKKLGGGEETITTYTYTQDWNGDVVESSHFKKPEGHANPARTVEPKVFGQDRATIGAFRLNADQAAATGSLKPLPASTGNEVAIRQALGGGRYVNVVEGRILVANDPGRPAIGDLRISHEVAVPGEATIVARQASGGFAPYVTSNGQEISIIRQGILTGAQVFADAQSGNMVVTWIIRVVGLLLMAGGFGAILAPIRVLADVVPVIGSLVGMGTSTVALILTLILGPSVIAIAWFASRPLLSLALIGGGVLLAVGLAMVRRRRGAASPA
jgi:hypothetical protein